MWMKKRFPLRATLCLFIVLLAACAPAPVTLGPALPENNSQINPVEVNPTAIALDVATATPAAMLLDTPTVLPIATSRGPKLEASDPSTVSMASGGLQLVEFFEFW